MSTYSLDRDYLDIRDVDDLLVAVSIDGEGECDADDLAFARAVRDALGADYDHVVSNQEPLIADHWFEDYAQQLAEDIGAIDCNAAWPAYCIDWAQAADDLKTDYVSVTINGVDYWFRG